MSAANTALAKEVIAAVRARDLERLVELTDPEVEWRSFFAIAEGGEYHGHDGIGKYVEDMREAWDTIQAVTEDLIGAGDVVVAVGHIHFQGKGSGVEFSSAAGWMFKFREGKLIVFRAFRDPEQALEAVGLSG